MSTPHPPYRLLLGSCPDSWGVWFADDPRQAPWSLITRFPSRIGYVHIKQMDPAIRAKAEAEDLSFGQAVGMGASCEPPYGLPDIPPVLAALDGLGAELFTVVEQDMYPCDFGKPKPIAARTYQYLNSRGLGGHDGGAA